ncbi:MAG TPA: tetratricopeptide repeat protein [Terriglobales bacterium]|nr:tetratricopeptide repeat protein [Terriglobales bacterium]
MLENTWAREYLTVLFEALGKDLEELSDLMLAVAQNEVEDPLLEIRFRRQSGSTVQCFNLAVAVLAVRGEDASLPIAADLIETIEECNSKLLAFQEELPRLRDAVAKNPEDGENLARLGVALLALDDRDSALTAFTKALEHQDTLCIHWERDCLNNIGWDHYQRGEHEQALGWFELACRLKRSAPERGSGNPLGSATEGDDDLPYNLALENVLLTLAKMGRLSEATARLQEYHSHFGRLPDYEARALEKMGLQPDVIYIRSRIERYAR